MDFTFNLTFLSCRRELRFPTASGFGRDSEIAPTEDVLTYLYNSLYYRIRLEREIKTGLSVKALLAMSSVSTQTFTKPICSMALYPAKHFHNHHPIGWNGEKIRTVLGNDEIIVGFWAHKFKLDIMSLSSDLRVLMNALSYFFRCNPTDNVAWEN